MAAPLPAGALPPPPAPSLPQAAATAAAPGPRSAAAAAPARPGLPAGLDGAPGVCVCLSVSLAQQSAGAERGGEWG